MISDFSCTDIFHQPLKVGAGDLETWILLKPDKIIRQGQARCEARLVALCPKYRVYINQISPVLTLWYTLANCLLTVT